MSETDSESKTKNDVYYERNLLALAFIQQYMVANFSFTYKPPFGWWPDTDDVNGEAWAVVWVNTTEGQVGWHVPTEMVPEWMPKRDPDYDGYSTETKNRRVARMVGVEEEVA